MMTFKTFDTKKNTKKIQLKFHGSMRQIVLGPTYIYQCEPQANMYVCIQYVYIYIYIYIYVYIYIYIYIYIHFFTTLCSVGFNTLVPKSE